MCIEYLQILYFAPQIFKHNVQYRKDVVFKTIRIENNGVKVNQRMFCSKYEIEI